MRSGPVWHRNAGSFLRTTKARGVEQPEVDNGQLDPHLKYCSLYLPNKQSGSMPSATRPYHTTNIAIYRPRGQGETLTHQQIYRVYAAGGLRRPKHEALRRGHTTEKLSTDMASHRQGYQVRRVRRNTGTPFIINSFLTTLPTVSPKRCPK